LDDLGGVREQQAADGGDFDPADLAAAVAGVADASGQQVVAGDGFEPS
jgi:hypothetical protein